MFVVRRVMGAVVGCCESFMWYCNRILGLNVLAMVRGKGDVEETVGVRGQF